jgi:hypothetical protein
MAWWHRPFWRLAGALALAWLLLYLPLLRGSHVLPWDAADQFYPTVYFNAHSLRHGLAPWWNPHVYSGYPQIADPQGMLFSPLLMAWMLIPADPGATWFAWGVLLHLLMGGVAMLAVLRQLGANALGALVGAIVFMAGGVAASRLEHVPIVIAYAYAPVVLLALRGFLAHPGWRRGTLLGLAAGILLVHLVQLTYLLVFLLGAYGIAGSIVHWRGYAPSQRRGWLAGALIAVLMALAIGLPQLLLSLAFMSLSNRAQLPLAAAAAASLDGRAFLTLFAPNALHALRGDYGGPASLVEAYFYLGVLPLLVLPWLAAAWRVPCQRRQLLFMLAVAVVATLYMLGTRTPFYGWLYAWLPGIAQFRRPSDAAYLLNLALAMATGLAASHFPADRRRPAIVLLSMAALWLALASLQMRGNGARWQVGSLMAAAVAALAAGWIASTPRGPAMRTVFCLLAVLVVDYRCFNLNGRFNENYDITRKFRRDKTVTFLSGHLHATPQALPSRIEPVGARPYWDNQIVLVKLDSSQGYNPLRYGLYDRWYGARDNGNLPRPAMPFNLWPDSALTDLLSVRYLVRNTDSSYQPWVPPAGYMRIDEHEGTEVWLNTRAYPRLLTPAAANLVQATALTPADFAATDFNERVWLTPRDERDRALAATDAEQCQGHRLRIGQADARPTTLDIRTDAAQGPAWLVLGELDFPGWQADVDGAPLAIHRANGMFRAVCVPAGRHRLRFVFHPWRMIGEAWRHRDAWR